MSRARAPQSYRCWPVIIFSLILSSVSYLIGVGNIELLIAANTIISGDRTFLFQIQDSCGHSTNDGSLVVEYGDSIYTVGVWDGAPVVVEKYKLLFFTIPKVGCTGWKQLFRRMMGLRNWKLENVNYIPWNPEINGLRYLYDYDRETASHMMTSPEWTRAIFVREPKERFLSAYLDKAFHETFIKKACCPTSGVCVSGARNSPQGFLDLIKRCSNPHWSPQTSRMEEKYWPYINFVGRMEHLEEDARRLLEKIGAWDEFGASGWGDDGSSSLFQSRSGGRMHATDARKKLQSYISPELEEELDDFYRKDYLNPVFHFNCLKVHNSN